MYKRRGRELFLTQENFKSRFSNQIPMSKYSIRPKYHHSCGAIERNENLARDWEQVEDDFTSLGGELSHWASDNTFQVTRGAIPIGETWSISCKVHTLLDQFAEYLSTLKNYRDIFLTDAWQFRSSVMEFSITSIRDSPNSMSAERVFLKPVLINIKHTASNQSRNYLRVFSVHNGIIQEIYVRNMNKASYAVPCFHIDDNYLIVETTHFSSFFACVCGEEHVNKQIHSISAIAFGRIYAEVNDNYNHKAELDFALKFVSKDSVATLQEFLNVSNCFCVHELNNA